MCFFNTYNDTSYCCEQHLLNTYTVCEIVECIEVYDDYGKNVFNLLEIRYKINLYVCLFGI